MFHQPLHEKPRFQIGAVEHRNIRIWISHLYIILDFLHDLAGLRLGIGKASGNHRLSRTSRSPDFLVKPGLVMPDQFSGVIHNV